FAFTTGRPMNSLSLPVHVPKIPALGAGAPSVATVAWLIGSAMCATTIVSVTLPPVTWLRKAIHPSPAAVGQPVKPGPVNTPPPRRPCAPARLGNEPTRRELDPHRHRGAGADDRQAMDGAQRETQPLAVPELQIERDRLERRVRRRDRRPRRGHGQVATAAAD